MGDHLSALVVQWSRAFPIGVTSKLASKGVVEVQQFLHEQLRYCRDEEKGQVYARLETLGPGLLSQDDVRPHVRLAIFPNRVTHFS